MSETRTPPQNGFEHSLSFVAGDAEKVDDTHSRFNLAFDKSRAGDFFVKHSHGQEPSRYLVTEFGRMTEDITKALESQGIEHLRVIRIEDGNCVYEVPPNAKPLLGESLNLEHESDETYISDAELFGKVGALWGQVYKATGCLPDGTVLAHTGMREFPDKEEQRIFPVPPYGDCQKIPDSRQAATIFESSIREELQTSYPRSPVGMIVEAAGFSFRGAIGNDPRTS